MHRCRFRLLAAIVVAASIFGSVASSLAQEPPRGVYAFGRSAEPPSREQAPGPFGKKQRSDWTLALEAVTNAPVDIGARVTAETPFRLRVATGFGVVPDAYLGIVNGVVSGMGAYDDRTADIIDGAFDGGTVWRMQLGFRPFPRAGFYVDGGYALVRLSGSIDGSDVSAPDVVVGGTSVRDAGYDLDTTVHMWLIEAGWQAYVLDRVVLGAALGVQGTIAADTDATPNFEQGRTAAGRSMSEQAVRDIDHVLETYGYVPTLTLRVGYDFL